MTDDDLVALVYRAADRVRDIAANRGRDPVVMLVEALVRIDQRAIEAWVEGEEADR